MKDIAPVIKVNLPNLSLHKIHSNDGGVGILWGEIIQATILDVQDEITPTVLGR